MSTFWGRGAKVAGVDQMNVVEQHVDVATDDGTMGTYVVRPADQGPHPVVLFLMDAPGSANCCTRWRDVWPPAAIT